MVTESQMFFSSPVFSSPFFSSRFPYFVAQHHLLVCYTGDWISQQSVLSIHLTISDVGMKQVKQRVYDFGSTLDISLSFITHDHRLDKRR